ncbi:AbrB/MazE/SpoVT family DNA-binding domain-containing protein [Candidatus Woesearchaeota archaeon]|nr:AbrB/MazE/SpoVT family DNA-binding domain-containing protein [Candidatus Woesearchaeota archaeon]
MAISLDKATMNCPCGGTMHRGLTKWKGMMLRSWKCPDCKEVALHPVDADRALHINWARKRRSLDVRVRKVGSSLTLTIPKIVVDAAEIRAGQRAHWNMKNGSEKRLEVTVE